MIRKSSTVRWLFARRAPRDLLHDVARRHGKRSAPEPRSGRGPALAMASGGGGAEWEGAILPGTKIPTIEVRRSIRNVTSRALRDIARPGSHVPGQERDLEMEKGPDAVSCSGPAAPRSRPADAGRRGNARSDPQLRRCLQRELGPAGRHDHGGGSGSRFPVGQPRFPGLRQGRQLARGASRRQHALHRSRGRLRGDQRRRHHRPL